MLDVHPSNTDALRGWDGDDGAYWAANVDIFERSAAGYDDWLLAGVAAGRVLDIGCGTGSLTRAAARRAGSAVGIDLSSAMLAVARRRAEAHGPGTVSFIQGDAQIHPFVPASFDVALSRTGAMFFGDPVAAFRSIGGALRPGGRLALVVWQSLAANEWMAELMRVLAPDRPLPEPAPGPARAERAPSGTEMPGPFSFADPARVRAVLDAAGFTDITVDDLREPMYFGPSAEVAYRFMAGLGGVRATLRGLGEADRARVRSALRAMVDTHTGPDGVHLGSAAWGVRAVRP
jgi:SAM-dependent methyltransferase